MTYASSSRERPLQRFCKVNLEPNRNISIDFFGLVLIVAMGACVRIVGLSNDWLWYDELLSVNFSAHGPLETLLTVARFDVHPPLYYLQLSLWMTFGASDAFVMANSVAWSGLTILIVYLAGRRLSGRVAGMLAATIVAVSPACIFFSHQVRMYSFISALLIAAFVFMSDFIRGDRRSSLVWAGGLATAAAYSHAAGILMASGVFAYALMQLVGRRNWRGIRAVVLTGVAVGAASLPAIGFVANRGINHASAPDLIEVGGSVRFLLVGTENAIAGLDGPLLVSAGVLLLGLVASARESRNLFATTVVFPIALIYLVSHLVTPIWLDRTVVFVVPFIALSVAVRIAALAEPSRWRAGVSVVLVCALLGASTLASAEQLRRIRKGDGYRPLSVHLATLARPGDILLLDMPAYSAWGVLWYFAGRDWGRPLDFHDVNPAWRRLLDRVGAEWGRRLRWVPSVRSYELRGVTVTATFLDPPVEIPSNARVILVRQGRGQDNAIIHASRRLAGAPRQFDNFTVEDWEPR